MKILKHKIERREPKARLFMIESLKRDLNYLTTKQILKLNAVKWYDKLALVFQKHKPQILLIIRGVAEISARAIKWLAPGGIGWIGEIIDKLADNIPLNLKSKNGGKKMSEEKKLTKGEMVQVAGRLVESVGVAMDDPESPDKITLAEALSLVQDLAKDVISEWND